MRLTGKFTVKESALWYESGADSFLVTIQLQPAMTVEDAHKLADIMNRSAVSLTVDPYPVSATRPETTTDRK